VYSNYCSNKEFERSSAQRYFHETFTFLTSEKHLLWQLLMGNIISEGKIWAIEITARTVPLVGKVVDWCGLYFSA